MDIEKLKSLLANDEKMVAQFLNIFKNETPKQLSQLQESIEKKDWKNVANIAHGLKSQVKYLDLLEIASIAFEIENIAENEEDIESIPMYFFQLEESLLKVMKDL